LSDATPEQRAIWRKRAEDAIASFRSDTFGNSDALMLAVSLLALPRVDWPEDVAWLDGHVPGHAPDAERDPELWETLAMVCESWLIDDVIATFDLLRAVDRAGGRLARTIPTRAPAVAVH
jgi:hypothetical protein